jgi:heat-inducible transcriptional repressor
MAQSQRSNLTERQKRIVDAVVVEHIITAQPVGSKRLCEAHGFRCSPATIRSEMVRLEHRGYLDQPHTSAGRIPLGPAYRLHVDGLKKAHSRLNRQITWVQGELRRLDAEPDVALRRTSDLLAQLTRYPAVVTRPSDAEGRPPRLSEVSLSPVSAQNVLFSFSDDQGHTCQTIIEAKAPLKAKDVQTLEQALCRLLVGRPLDTLLDLSELPAADEGVLAGIRKALDEASAGYVYVEGTRFMLDQPEFGQIERLRRVMRTLSQSPLLLRLLQSSTRPASAGPVSVTIGNEHGVESLSDCSVVAAGYRGPGYSGGAVGVVGPMRMDYGLAMAAVACVARELGHTLNQRY